MTAIIVLCIVVLLVLCFVSALYIPFDMAFQTSKHRENEDRYAPYNLNQYTDYLDVILPVYENSKKEKFERVYTESFDGLKLSGRYFHYKDSAPVMILFHGYRGTGEKDGSGALAECKKMGMNILIVDQRGQSDSGGRIMTFGVKEKYDVLSWVYFVNKKFGENTEIILMGISMGASTVLLASGEKLPCNVVGIIADSAYSNPKDIIKEVIAQKKLPVKLIYPLVYYGARLFGKFDLNDGDVIKAVSKANIPILLVHGERDTFVPFYMGMNIYKAINSEKYLFTCKDADHVMSYILDYDGYMKNYSEFIQRVTKKG